MVASPARGELNRKNVFAFFKGEGERRGQLRGMSPGNLFQASSPTVHRDAEFSSGGQLMNPFKCHEEVLYLQPMIPPKRFDIFSP